MSTRRRRVLITTVMVSVVVLTAWRFLTRHDPRFVGTWSAVRSDRTGSIGRFDFQSGGLARESWKYVHDNGAHVEESREWQWWVDDQGLRLQQVHASPIGYCHLCLHDAYRSLTGSGPSYPRPPVELLEIREISQTGIFLRGVREGDDAPSEYVLRRNRER